MSKPESPSSGTNYSVVFQTYVQNAEPTCTTHAVVSEEQLTTSVELVSDPGGVVTRV